MKHLLAFILTVSIPCLFFLTVKQSQVYNTLEREVNAYNDEQNRLIAENKRKIIRVSLDKEKKG